MAVVENARITSTFLGIDEDHGLFTAEITLGGDGWGQGFGGYCMSAYSGEWLELLLRAVGAKSWEALPGLNVRIKRGEGLDEKIRAVGHIVENRWFEPEALKHLAVEKKAEKGATDGE